MPAPFRHAVTFVLVAVFLGALCRPAVARLGEFNATLIGLAVSAIAGFGYGLAFGYGLDFGYGLASGLGMVVVLKWVHDPEGVVHPMLTAMMSRLVPEDAQGELQGGIAAIINLSMLAGTVVFSQILGYFIRSDAAFQSSKVAYFVASGTLVLTLAMLITPVGRDQVLDKTV